MKADIYACLVVIVLCIVQLYQNSKLLNTLKEKDHDLYLSERRGFCVASGFLLAVFVVLLITNIISLIAGTP